MGKEVGLRNTEQCYGERVEIIAGGLRVYTAVLWGKGWDYGGL